MRTRRGQPPVQGVVNSGGILADAVIASQTAEGVRREPHAGRTLSTAEKGWTHSAKWIEPLTIWCRHCRAVFAPKLASTVALAAAAAQEPLTTHVLFSSAASLLGAPGTQPGLPRVTML